MTKKDLIIKPLRRAIVEPSLPSREKFTYSAVRIDWFEQGKLSKRKCTEKHLGDVIEAINQQDKWKTTYQAIEVVDKKGKQWILEVTGLFTAAGFHNRFPSVQIKSIEAFLWI